MASSAPNVCANCGKGEEESDNLKKCSACFSVKYCSRDCQVAHRSQHKKACKKRVAELRDEQLFKEVEREECPICLLPLPFENNASGFQFCCGKRICSGCIIGMMESEQGARLCPYCREPNLLESSDEHIKRAKKLMDKGNAEALLALGGYYAYGFNGLLEDMTKARELWLKAGELGCAHGYYNLGKSYDNGTGVEMDKKKAKHYYELAAMAGHVFAQYSLGIMEGNSRNLRRSVKYFMVSARAGHKESLEGVKIGYKSGLVTKDEYADTLRASQKRLDEMKSDARDYAARGLTNLRAPFEAREALHG